MTYKEIEDLVYGFKTSHKMGFNPKEEERLLEELPDMEMDKYYEAMQGNTCAMNEEGEVVSCHCDVIKAIKCGLEDRDLKFWEWD